METSVSLKYFVTDCECAKMQRCTVYTRIREYAEYANTHFVLIPYIYINQKTAEKVTDITFR